MTRKAWIGLAVFMTVSAGCDQRIDPEDVEDAEVEEAVLGAPELVALGAFVFFGVMTDTVRAVPRAESESHAEYWDENAAHGTAHGEEPWDSREQAMDDIWAFEDAIGEFYMHNGRYPNRLSQVREYLPNGYVRNDPWGNPYEYDADRSGYEIKSYGADGRKGGKGLDADIEWGDR